MSAATSDVEIVVLGKGIGESVLLRLDDEWVIIDSFRDPSGDRRPAPLSFLDGRGVDVVQKVRAVILTHLHADHSEGIDEVVDVCESARLLLPAAVPDEAWHRVLKTLVAEGRPGRTKMQEISNAFRIAIEEGRFTPVGATGIVATRRPELFVIGPASKAIIAARGATDDAAGVTDTPPHAALRENFTSIVLWLRADAVTALLTGDMDRHGEFGWHALVQEHANTDWIAGASFVKVAHHGSANAHETSVFTAWTATPVAVLTPNRGSRLPTQDMLTSLKKIAASVWIAGPTAGGDLNEVAVRSDARTVAVEARSSRATGHWLVAAEAAQEV